MADTGVEYQLSWKWAVRSVPAGLAVYELDQPVPSWIHDLPPDKAHFDLVLAADLDRVPPDDMLAALARFADEVVVADRSRLRVRLPRGTSPGVRWMVRTAVPAPQLDQGPAPGQWQRPTQLDG